MPCVLWSLKLLVSKPFFTKEEAAFFYFTLPAFMGLSWVAFMGAKK